VLLRVTWDVKVTTEGIRVVVTRAARQWELVNGYSGVKVVKLLTRKTSSGWAESDRRSSKASGPDDRRRKARFCPIPRSVAI